MERLGVLVPLICMIYLAVFALVMVGYIQQETTEKQQLHLQYSSTKAVDAAIERMLYDADRSTSMDVHDLAGLTVNPQIALDTFVDVFLTNYDIPMTEQNRIMVRTQFIPVFCVVTNDGYYLATLQKVDNGKDEYGNSLGRGDGYDLAFSMKYPFTWKDNDGTMYNLTLSQQYVWQLKNGKLMRIAMDKVVPSLYTPTRLVNQQGYQQAINRTVLGHIANEIARINQESSTVEKFFIPDDLNSVLTINPIQGVSVICLLQNVNLDTKTPLHTLSIGGAKIVKARAVVGYQRNGNRYYCYADLAPNNVVIEQSFSSPTNAALAGYYCDMEYMYTSEPGYPQPGTFEDYWNP